MSGPTTEAKVLTFPLTIVHVQLRGTTLPACAAAYRHDRPSKITRSPDDVTCLRCQEIIAEIRAEEAEQRAARLRREATGAALGAESRPKVESPPSAS